MAESAVQRRRRLAAASSLAAFSLGHYELLAMHMQIDECHNITGKTVGVQAMQGEARGGGDRNVGVLLEAGAA